MESEKRIFTLIAKRDTKSYSLAIVELDERIGRIIDESAKLQEAIEQIKTFGTDYNQMTEEQQYALGSYLNFMAASTQLLINPILGLQAKFSEEDFERFIKEKNYEIEHKDTIIFMANLLYKISLDDKDKKLLWKTFKKNKKMLESLELSKKEFDFMIIDKATEALDFIG